MRYRILKTGGICRNLIEKYAVIVKETRLYIIIEASPSDIDLLLKQCSGIHVIPEEERSIRLHQFGYSLGDAVTIDEIKSLVGFDKLKNAGYSDANVIVSVIGTGCNVNELPEHIAKRVTLLDFTDEGPQDDLNHDTNVIRILGELAPNVQIRSIKVISEDRVITTRDMLDAVEDAYFESHIVNCSWGFEGNQCQFFKWYHGLMNFVYYAEPPLYFVASAGNENGTFNAVTYPAADPYAIAVAATDRNDTVTDFSSRGPFVCDGLTVSKPDVATYGVIDIDGTVLAGTSYSAPVVTAFIAHLYSRESLNKGLNILQGHRVNPKYLTEKWCSEYGYGILKAFSGSYAGIVASDVASLMMPVAAMGIAIAFPLVAIKSVVDMFNRL